MVIGTGQIQLRLAESHSLKDKRRQLKSLLARIQNEFNISAAEVGSNDLLQRADIGFAMVGNDSRYINSKMDKLLNLVEAWHAAEVIGSQTELIHL